MSLNISSSYHPSSYLVQRIPGFYGGQQEDYIRQSREAIKQAVEKISITQKQESFLINLFFELLKDFGQARQKIAKMHGTEKAEEFGRRRDIEGKKEYYNTYLDKQYLGYRSKILQTMATPQYQSGLKQAC